MTMGVLLGFDKVHQFLPGYVLSNVFAHAHLAAVGWVVHDGRSASATACLPMVIPAASPAAAPFMSARCCSRRASSACSCRCYCGARSRRCSPARDRRRLRRRRRARGVDAQSPANAVAWKAGEAGLRWRTLRPLASGCCAACVFGVVLTICADDRDDAARGAALRRVRSRRISRADHRRVRAAHAADGCRVLGASAWRGQRKPAHNRLERSAIYCAWLAGVPALGAGLFFNAPIVLAAGAWLLFGATVVNAIGTTRLIFPGRAGSSGLPSRASRSTIRGRQGGHQ